ncbi:biopolymer transporter ExbD [Methyloradius palustris]|uniref:TolR-like protein n=1 Tax=Methyloradius palustris TaxID=2778876 RepID=A0A8D5GAA8_9PROT|nr:biopolymer transporter ExbD [Methyloradius palustris]BCM25987.1 TolR-like protein [Methyloradius palustris]
MLRTRKRRVMNQINVVPYIDVTLVLLVIFMVTAPMTNPGVVELPKVGSDVLKQQTAPMVITLQANGKIEFQEKTLEKDQLLFEIKQQLAKTPDTAFVVSADKKTSYEQVAQLLEILKRSGAPKTGLLLNPSN